MDKLVDRPQLSLDEIRSAINYAEEKTRRGLEEKGNGSLISRHEILGVVTEEYKELIEAVEQCGSDEVAVELMDIAVACIIGWTSITSGKTEW